MLHTSSVISRLSMLPFTWQILNSFGEFFESVKVLAKSRRFSYVTMSTNVDRIWYLNQGSKEQIQTLLRQPRGRWITDFSRNSFFRNLDLDIFFRRINPIPYLTSSVFPNISTPKPKRLLSSTPNLKIINIKSTNLQFHSTHNRNQGQYYF